MSQTFKANFSTRREAELAVEHLVQAHGIDRRAIQITPRGPDNSAGEAPSGSDEAAAEPSTEARDDAALEGPIVVSVGLETESQVEGVRKAFEDAAAGSA